MGYEAVFFAAQNTTRGFRSYFSEIFDPDGLADLFIIKGGPGTGKSGLMRRLASEAENRGMKAERFVCSSDPDSLDGVLIPEIGAALADGTSPHTLDPVYPGAVENIVNTGAFWDVGKLREHKGEILRLIREGRVLYRRAYRYLAALGEIAEEMQRIGMQGFRKEKMRSQIKRLAGKAFTKGGSGKAKTRVLSTFNKNGLERLPGFGESAKEVYFVRDHAFTGTVLLAGLAEEAKEKGQPFIRCPSPLFPDQPEALFFPETACYFTLEPEGAERQNAGHILNMTRFTDREMVRANSRKLRFGKKCADSLLHGAAESFREAAAAHGELERFYVSAMDFAALNGATEDLIRRLYASE